MRCLNLDEVAPRNLSSMKRLFTIFLLMCSGPIFAQSFDILGAVYADDPVELQGQVVVDVANKNIDLTINGKQMTIQKMTFKKGERGELKCYKESIETKQRIVFTPNKNKTGYWFNATHIMTYTVVQGFSRNKTQVVYYLKKQRKIK